MNAVPVSAILADMARRRYQHPPVYQTSTRDKAARRWYFTARVDALTGPGETKRVERRIYLGDVKEIGKREAEQKRDEVLAQTINRPADVIQSQILFGAVVDKFLELASVRPQTLRHYEYLCEKHIRGTWGSIRMCDITPLAVEAWLVGLSRQYRKGTVDSTRRLFGTIWKAALRWQMTREACPASLCPPVKSTKAERRNDLPTVQQWHKILATLNEPYRSIALIAAYTGMRIGEVLALTWEKFAEENPLIEESAQQDGAIGPVKTKTSVRRVYMGELHSSIERPAGVRGRMFTVLYRSVQNALRDAGKAAGIEYEGFGCHTLRRMFNTMFRRETPDVSLAMAQMGHATARVNERYRVEGEPELRARIEAAKRVAARMERVN